MLYYFTFGSRTCRNSREYVFDKMDTGDWGIPIYGIFIFTGDRADLNSSFMRVKDFKIGQDAWYDGQEWIPCD